MHAMMDSPDVGLVIRPHPFSSEKTVRTMPARQSIAAMLEACDLNPDDLEARVFIDDVLVEKAYWSRVKPKAGHLVTVRVVPQGGGGGSKDILRIVAMVGVLALAVAAPYIAAAVLPGALGIFFGSGVGAALLSAGVVFGGTLLVNSLIPPPKPNLPQLGGSEGFDRSPALSLSGGRNDLRPYAPVPRVYGRMRITPPLAAEPYTEIVGNDQYLRMLFTCGYGPLLLSDFRIGETPLGQFDGVETQVLSGAPDEPSALPLYSNDIHEEALSLPLNFADGYQQRTAQPDADELSVDIIFPQGIYVILTESTSAGDPVFVIDVAVEVQYRKVGESAWQSVSALAVTQPTQTEVTGGPVVSFHHGAFAFSGRFQGNTKAVRRGIRWKPIGGKGQYEIRVARLTEDATNQNVIDKCFWSCLRTIKYQTPVTLRGVSLIALRIKATDQLNGIVDQFNCVAHSILPAWNGFAWVEQTTSNPAAIYRDILQGSANARPKPDRRLDLPTLQDWAEECDQKGRTCHVILDWVQSEFEALKLVAACGRASFDLRDGKYSVVMDRPQTTLTQLFTPRNSRDFTGNKVFTDLPHALKINFVNEEADWQPDELLVYDDGYDQTNAAKFDTLDLVGVTNPDQAWKDGRYHIAQARLRPEVFELTTDFEHLICTRGDLVGVMHDVPRWGLGVGRIKTVTLNGTNEATSITVDHPLVMDQAFRYVVRYRRDDGSQFLKEIVAVTGEHTTLAFVANVPAVDVPQVGNLIGYGELGSEFVRCLVKTIDPKPNLEARLTLLDEAPGIHTADTQAIPQHNPQISIPIPQRKPLPPIVDEVISDERALVRDMDGSLRNRILIRIHYVSGIIPPQRIEARYKRTPSTESWAQTAIRVDGDADELEIPQVVERETYDIMLRAVSKYEVASDWVSLPPHTVTGRTTPPPDVGPMTLQGTRLKWAYPLAPPDFAGFAVRMQFGDRQSWSDAVPLHDGIISHSFLDLDSIGGVRTYLVKAIDTAHYESANPAVLVMDWGDRIVENVVDTVDYKALGFPGTIEHGAVVLGNLEAAAGSPWWTADSDPMWTNPSAPFWGVASQQMTYTFLYTPPSSVVEDGTLFLDVTVE